MDKIFFRATPSSEIRQDTDSRRVTFVASDGTRDSAHTVLNPDGWDLQRFNNNGIIGYQHEVYGGWDAADPDKVIGKGRAYMEDSKLMVDVDFEPAEINSLAEKIYQKVLFGSLRAVSVGFLPKGKGAWGKGEEAPGEARETYYYAGQELLEVSVVNIPANPNALRKALDAEADELAALRAEGQPEPPKSEPDPAPKSEPDPDPQQAPEEKALELEKATTIARAALLIS